MAQYKITNLQHPKTFNAEILPMHLGHELVVDVPPGFIMTGAAISVRQAFNGTTPAFSVTDNKATPTVIIASTAATAVATTSATAGSLYAEYPNGGKIRVLPTGTGATVGRADIFIQGIVRGVQNERFGANIPT